MCRWPNGTAVSYRIEELNTGVLLDQLYQETNDPRLAKHISILRAAYWGAPNQKLNPFASPPSRPPVRHMVNIYGVDMPTLAKMRVERDPAPPGNLFMKEGVDEVAGGGLVSTATGQGQGSTGLRHSGDGTVPYWSLSWSHMMHANASNVVTREVPARWLQYYDNLIGQWGEATVFNLMDAHEPAHTRSDSVANGGQASTVIEVAGLEHRDTVKNPFVLKMIDEMYLEMYTGMLNPRGDGSPPVQ